MHWFHGRLPGSRLLWFHGRLHLLHPLKHHEQDGVNEFAEIVQGQILGNELAVNRDDVMLEI